MLARILIWTAIVIYTKSNLEKTTKTEYIQPYSHLSTRWNLIKMHLCTTKQSEKSHLSLYILTASITKIQEKCFHIT